MSIKKTFLTAIISLFILSTTTAKNNDLPTTKKEPTTAEYEEMIEVLELKVDSLAAAKKNANTKEEKKAIKKELREVKREVKDIERRAGGGIYISVGALLVIIIILLLI